ncbi:30S ribosomal protein S1 [Chitinivibrio alkaliphilus]|uniref:30S ribosomal protein S1 n=1 Tax=Chitinivibrio alkaliphilus ACht1 TaxID=1313304 RepID=U7D8W6_9BACT|nr:30S ribosomal protein S1 [Chitinivibrio alkaliphilus]ERP31547.1 ribosomal protein S1 [Chitinivibrio alkaliphilus ACht1]
MAIDNVKQGIDAQGNPVDLSIFSESNYKPGEVDQILSAYEEQADTVNSVSNITEKEIVKGKILDITNNEVYVDIDFKSEGAIPVTQFRNIEEYAPGDEIDVFIERLEGEDGNLVLSKTRADFLKVWDKINDAYEEGDIVQGKLLRRIKGGIVVDLFGIDAFLPGSQIALRQIPDMDEIIGKTFDFKVIKVNKLRRNIVVSRRVILEEERAELRDQTIAKIEKGKVITGEVKNITDFGAFIDLGGVDGLLHITDMSWGRVNDPHDIVEMHQKLDVMVLDYNKNKERISLGLKQLSEHPWDGIEEKYPEGTRVRGRVVSITDYGAFMEIEKGIEGLIHISEMSWTQHIKHPSKIVSVGDIVEAVVLKIDRNEQKISLGLKQLEPDPWDNIREEFPIGSIVTGKVRNLASFGAFVELKEGIDGLIHISDMSWTKKITTADEILSKGDMIDVKVIDIDESKRRISLGLKQLTEDPWDELSQKFVVGNSVEVEVCRMLDRGIIVNLGNEVEGFIPLKELGREVKHPVQIYRRGDTFNAQVIEFDLDGKRIILSIKECEDFQEHCENFPVKEDIDLEQAIAAEDAEM